jgi:DNA repair protein RecO (recombination protein O)
MLRLYYYVDISKISNLDIDKSVSNKINDLLNEYYDTYSGIHPKSKSFLKTIE